MHPCLLRNNNINTVSVICIVVPRLSKSQTKPILEIKTVLLERTNSVILRVSMFQYPDPLSSPPFTPVRKPEPLLFQYQVYRYLCLCTCVFSCDRYGQC